MQARGNEGSETDGDPGTIDAAPAMTSGRSGKPERHADSALRGSSPSPGRWPEPPRQTAP